jgi:hypothetical protein
MLRKVLIVILCQAFAVQLSLAGQISGPLGLRLVVSNGEGVKHKIDGPSTEPITILLIDRDNKPVSGASVILTSPPRGPSIEFPNGSNSITLTTDSGGRAVVERYVANSAPGTYNILVRAEFLGESATTSIEQTNLSGKASHTKLITILAIAGGAVGAAVVAGSRGGGSSGSSTGNTSDPISFGGSSVGAPR